MDARSGSIDLACSRIAAMVSQLRQMAISARDASAGANVELEVRLGRIADQGGAFQVGVTRDTMDELLRGVEAFEGWSSVGDWEESHDFYYRIDGGMPVRSTVLFDAAACVIERRHMRKVSLMRMDLRHIHSSGSPPPSEFVDARVDLSMEEPVSEGVLPLVVNEFTLVRIKQRRSFLLRARGAPDSDPPAWRYDFTFSWAGRTKAEAEHMQKTAAPVCEVEIELAGADAYMRKPEHTDASTAASLLMKVADFVGRDEESVFHFEPVQRSVPLGVA